MKKIINDKIDFSLFNKLPMNCLHFLKNLLEKNPEKRFSAREALNHAWLVENEKPNKIKPEEKKKLLQKI